MKQYFAIINGVSVCSQDKISVVNWLEGHGINDFEITDSPETESKYIGIRIKPKGTSGESITAHSHTEFYSKLKELT